MYTSDITFHTANGSVYLVSAEYECGAYMQQESIRLSKMVAAHAEGRFSEDEGRRFYEVRIKAEGFYAFAADSEETARTKLKIRIGITGTGLFRQEGEAEIFAVEEREEETIYDFVITGTVSVYALGRDRQEAENYVLARIGKDQYVFFGFLESPQYELETDIED